MTRFLRLSTFATVAALAIIAHAWADDSPDVRLVEILSTRQDCDPFLPWRQGTPETSIGYGVLIGDGRILTTENLVRNSRLIEFRRAKSGARVAATIQIADEQLNLALLKTTDAAALTLPSLAVASTVSTSTPLQVFQFNESRQLQKGRATYLHATMAPLPTAPYPSLRLSVLTDLNIQGEGAPMLSDGTLAGIIMSYDSGSRVGEAIPSVTLHRFLEDCAAPVYRGVASAGIQWIPLIDPFKRAYLGASAHDGGCVILSVLDNTPAASVLQTDDVLLSWDGFTLDSLGFYVDPDYGRIDLSYAVKGRRWPGEAVPVQILRQGTLTNVSVTLGRRLDAEQWIPEAIVETQPEYVVEGGLVIREVSSRYLMAQGERGDSRLSHLYRSKRFTPPAPADRIVVLATILPDPINLGYPSFQNDIITHVNGEEIHNLNSVFEILDRDTHIHRITLHGVGTDLVLDPAQIDKANIRIARQFDISRMQYRKHSTKVATHPTAP